MQQSLYDPKKEDNNHTIPAFTKYTHYLNRQMSSQRRLLFLTRFPRAPAALARVFSSTPWTTCEEEVDEADNVDDDGGKARSA